VRVKLYAYVNARASASASAPAYAFPLEIAKAHNQFKRGILLGAFSGDMPPTRRYGGVVCRHRRARPFLNGV